ncbi:MAG: enoyl-CoA hydratase/isomerase family protein [Micrococcus sp.]|nr:enoyl-CoA hydratase/isomerase family protein [Micrococcus sp.]
MTAAETPAATEELLISREGHLGVIVLNRPKAINALTHGMVAGILEQLTAWQDDDDVAAVLIRGAGDRGLCAGGDIVSVYRSIQAEEFAEAEEFFRTEYRMNLLISDYPKPVVAFQDGIVLGGGVGVSGHASHRVATERTRWGMPETGIGLVPDVGGTYLISRLEGGFGPYLGMTGTHITGADAVFLGLSSHHVDSSDLDAIQEALATEAPDAVLARFASESGEAGLAAEAEWIHTAFGQGAPAEIQTALQERSEEGAAQAAKALSRVSPMAQTVTLEAVRRAAQHDSLADVLVQEFRVTAAHLREHDFPEGIRALLVDKDKNPQWQPAAVQDVTQEQVERYFTEPATGDLTF